MASVASSLDSGADTHSTLAASDAEGPQPSSNAILPNSTHDTIMDAATKASSEPSNPSSSVAVLSCVQLSADYSPSEPAEVVNATVSTDDRGTMTSALNKEPMQKKHNQRIDTATRVDQQPAMDAISSASTSKPLVTPQPTTTTMAQKLPNETGDSAPSSNSAVASDANQANAMPEAQTTPSAAPQAHGELKLEADKDATIPLTSDMTTKGEETPDAKQSMESSRPEPAAKVEKVEGSVISTKPVETKTPPKGEPTVTNESDESSSAVDMDQTPDASLSTSTNAPLSGDSVNQATSTSTTGDNVKTQESVAKTDAAGDKQSKVAGDKVDTAPDEFYDSLEDICARHCQYVGGLPCSIEETEPPEDGLKVWGKMDGYRPWPGYIMLKRNAKKEGIYTQFYGPDDEYIWLPHDQLTPLLPHHLPELARDCEDQKELCAALVDAYSDNMNCCAYCWYSFHTRFALDSHVSTHHKDCDPLTDDDLMVTRLRFRHHAQKAVDQAYSSNFTTQWEPTTLLASIENSTKVMLDRILKQNKPEHRFDPVTAAALFEAELAKQKEDQAKDDQDETADTGRSLRSNTNLPPTTPSGPPIKTSSTGHRFMSAPRRKTNQANSDGRDEDSVYSQAEIRIGEDYQVPPAMFPEANTRAARETRPDTTNLVWCPDEELEELEGYNAYFKFANTRGLRQHSDSHFNTGDVEYAYHILYHAHGNTSRTAKRFVITEALKMLTSKTQVKLTGPYRNYHYTGSNPWNKQEKELFLKGYRTYGKQFHLIADMLPHKAHSDVVEYYYAYFKRDPVFSKVKMELRERAIREAFRAQTEGAVTACDHCQRTKTPRWREGPNNEDWCDQCYWYHYSHGQLPIVCEEYRSVSPLEFVPWVKRPGRKPNSRNKRPFDPSTSHPAPPAQTKPKRSKPRSRSRQGRKSASPKPVRNGPTNGAADTNIRRPAAQPALASVEEEQPEGIAVDTSVQEQTNTDAQPVMEGQRQAAKSQDDGTDNPSTRKPEQDSEQNKFLALQAQLKRFEEQMRQKQQPAGSVAPQATETQSDAIVGAAQDKDTSMQSEAHGSQVQGPATNRSGLQSDLQSAQSVARSTIPSETKPSNRLGSSSTDTTLPSAHTAQIGQQSLHGSGVAKQQQQNDTINPDTQHTTIEPRDTVLTTVHAASHNTGAASHSVTVSRSLHSQPGSTTHSLGEPINTAQPVAAHPATTNAAHDIAAQQRSDVLCIPAKGVSQISPSEPLTTAMALPGDGAGDMDMTSDQAVSTTHINGPATSSASNGNGVANIKQAAPSAPSHHGLNATAVGSMDTAADTAQLSQDAR
eukprot:TRINITY_DN9935_c0_g1_i1.p1 TRINITY_DN9935_c0_g1~~TRINITY_DN9935_c0_g1_i1.p1  ORF type:complete len:1314 (+),score=294.12 TRINITY_DN9935_c0_g1_i1:40-3981(+)